MDQEDDGREITRRRVLAASGAITGGWLAGCVGSGENPAGGGGGADGNNEEMAGGGENEDSDADADGSVQEESDGGDGMEEDSMTTGDESGWQSRELTDVLTDESFSISELAGPVVIQTFAVWCPKCERQSEELTGLDESITRVGLNIDPNEDAAKVKQHADRNGFDWRFAIASTDMTESLVDEFGPSVTNAPSTPIIVACDDGSTTFFSGSHQSAEDLHAAAAEC